MRHYGRNAARRITRQCSGPAGTVLCRSLAGCAPAADRPHVMSQEEDYLSDALEAVHDEESFLQFLLALRDDREASVAEEKVNPSSPYGPDARGWNSTTIELFLDTAVRWARASKNGLPRADYAPPSNPWRRCADILCAAKSYE